MEDRSGLIRPALIAGLLIGMPLVLFLVSLCLGRYQVDPVTAIMVLAAAITEFIPGFPVHISHIWPNVVDTIVLNIRLPRIIAAMLIGAGLSLSGASFQGLFRNPLVSPHILGVASGAGFGAALGILISGSGILVQALAFAFGIIAVGVTYLLARTYRSTPTLVLILAGIIVGSFFSAMISLTKYAADPYDKLPAIVFWLMGSLSSVEVSDIFWVAPLMLICMGILLLIRWRINLLAMGDDEAKALGVNTRQMSQVIIITATIITATAVCISGIIGWVGLVVPHIARMIVGPDYRKILPVSLVIGASYLLIVDDIARTLMAAEIPLGILTAVIGAPVFAYLLRYRNVGWR